jgi:hypothetical protein
MFSVRRRSTPAEAIDQSHMMKQPDQLADHRSIWERKPLLGLVYDGFYDRIAAACLDET